MCLAVTTLHIRVHDALFGAAVLVRVAETDAREADVFSYDAGGRIAGHADDGVVVAWEELVEMREWAGGGGRRKLIRWSGGKGGAGASVEDCCEGGGVCCGI